MARDLNNVPGCWRVETTFTICPSTKTEKKREKTSTTQQKKDRKKKTRTTHWDEQKPVMQVKRNNTYRVYSPWQGASVLSNVMRTDMWIEKRTKAWSMISLVILINGCRSSALLPGHNGNLSYGSFTFAWINFDHRNTKYTIHVDVSSAVKRLISLVKL